MVSNIPFGSYQPEWTDYLKFSVGISEKWPFNLLPSIRNFRNFFLNGKHPWRLLKVERQNPSLNADVIF